MPYTNPNPNSHPFSEQELTKSLAQSNKVRLA